LSARHFAPWLRPGGQCGGLFVGIGRAIIIVCSCKMAKDCGVSGWKLPASRGSSGVVKWKTKITTHAAPSAAHA